MDFLARELSGQEVSETEREKRSSAVVREKNATLRAAEAEKNATLRAAEAEKNAALRAAEAERRAERRAEARAAAKDYFLKKSGIVFGGWVGFGLAGTGIGAEKEVAQTKDGNVVKNPDGTTAMKTEHDVGIGGIGEIELRLLRYFGIQTGIGRITDYAPYTLPSGEKQYSKVSITQIPLLARLHFSVFSITLAGFGGVGMNVAVSADSGSAYPGMSFIAGAEAGLELKPVEMFLRYRYTGSLSGGSLTVNGRSYDYSMGNHMLGAGLRFHVPFRK
jgi:hypothetical protein